MVCRYEASMRYVVSKKYVRGSNVCQILANKFGGQQKNIPFSQESTSYPVELIVQRAMRCYQHVQQLKKTMTENQVSEKT